MAGRSRHVASGWQRLQGGALLDLAHVAGRMRLPRVLVIPHLMGRTIGSVGDRARQRQVIEAALRLLVEADRPESGVALGTRAGTRTRESSSLGSGSAQNQQRRDMSFALSDAVLPVPDRVREGLRQEWRRLAAPGTWLTGQQRIALAAEARAARTFADAHTELPEPLIEAAQSVSAAAHLITGEWVTDLVARGVAIEQYVEIVGRRQQAGCGGFLRPGHRSHSGAVTAAGTGSAHWRALRSRPVAAGVRPYRPRGWGALRSLGSTRGRAWA